MERVNLGYSTKNIPIPKFSEYQKCLIMRTENFMRAIRWRTFFYLNPEIRAEPGEKYGFKSTKSPPYILELKQFEDGMLELVRSIKCKRISNPFQRKLDEDCASIRGTNTLLVAADKTTNFYKVEPQKYRSLLNDNITMAYKKTTCAAEEDITKEDKRIASDLKLSDRIDTLAKRQSFITLKDHKPNFVNKPTCRLINPCKSEIGAISKQILEKINTKVKQTSLLRSWKNSGDVIHWFQNADTRNSSFVCFDVCEFYPSITEQLLKKAIIFASQYIQITEQDKEIIFHSKKSLLFNEGSPWCKKKGNPWFDVAMGSYDGAEVCELVGLYVLSILQRDIPNANIGLYRDDGLAICRGTPRQIELIKKSICQTFQKLELSITIEANKRTVDFLDLTLDINTGKYKPYMKPGNSILYVHRSSNHPPSITNNIPESINKRLSSISSDQIEFDSAAPPYQEALKQSGYDYILKYKPQLGNQMNSKRRRNRNVTWFNPPYSCSISTKIGGKFFRLLDRCFPPNHQLYKILNRNTVKISYSCMPNIGQTISAHNNKCLRNNETIQEANDRTCNCRAGTQECPVDGKCLTEAVIYQATVVRTDTNAKETYIGLTANTFKTRYNAHTNTFRNPTKRNATTLSCYVWSLKDDGIPYNISWRIVKQAGAYSTSSKRCLLCLTEKWLIIYKGHLGMGTLNTRNELVSSCRHRRKHLLDNT